MFLSFLCNLMLLYIFCIILYYCTSFLTKFAFSCYMFFTIIFFIIIIISINALRHYNIIFSFFILDIKYSKQIIQNKKKFKNAQSLTKKKKKFFFLFCFQQKLFRFIIFFVRISAFSLTSFCHYIVF